MKRLQRSNTSPKPPDYRALEGLLNDAAWKAGALRALAMREGLDLSPSRAPAAREAPQPEPQAPRDPLRLLTAQVSGTPSAETCRLTTRVGARERPEQPVQDGPLRLATLLESEHDALVSLSCRQSGWCWGGCETSTNGRIDESLHVLRLTPTTVVLTPTLSMVAPDHDSGADANRSTPQQFGAADAPQYIAPFRGRVSYRGLDTTDYVRVYPAASHTAALLCSRAPLADGVRARRDNEEVPIGAPVFGGRCVAASASQWDGLVFHIVSTTTDGFDYEILALSGEREPALGLVAWFVAQRLANDPSLTRKERTLTTRELLRAFDVALDKERRQLEVAGDRTVVAFVDMLAEIAQESP